MKKLLSLSVGLAALALASPATAALTFDFTSGSNSAVNGSNGNTLTKTDLGSGLSVTASAWWYNPTNSVNTPQSAYLGQYTHGLGVTDHNAGEDGSSNSHTIDNYGNRDFVVLVFNQAVNIQSAVLSPFAVNGSTDNDSWISYSALSAFNSSTFTDLLTRDYDLGGTGSPYSVTLAPSAGQFGNVWLIGAANSAAGYTDSHSDGFKLSSVVVNAVVPTQHGAVPEPATWAMMLVGFGGIGMAMRRSRGAKDRLVPVT